MDYVLDMLMLVFELSFLSFQFETRVRDFFLNQRGNEKKLKKIFEFQKAIKKYKNNIFESKIYQKKTVKNIKFPQCFLKIQKKIQTLKYFKKNRKKFKNIRYKKKFKKNRGNNFELKISSEKNI